MSPDRWELWIVIHCDSIAIFCWASTVSVLSGSPKSCTHSIVVSVSSHSLKSFKIPQWSPEAAMSSGFPGSEQEEFSPSLTHTPAFSSPRWHPRALSGQSGKLSRWYFPTQMQTQTQGLSLRFNFWKAERVATFVELWKGFQKLRFNDTSWMTTHNQKSKPYFQEFPEILGIPRHLV